MNSKELFFNTLIDENIAQWRGIAYRVLNNPSDADDAIQEALVKAWRKFGDLRDKQKIAGWLYRIIINECYNVLRKRARRGEVELNLDIAAERAGNITDCEGIVRLEKAIAALPEIYRETIQLAVIDDIPADEAATRLGCSPGAVYQRVYKAKALLGAVLRKEDFYE